MDFAPFMVGEGWHRVVSELPTGPRCGKPVGFPKLREVPGTRTSEGRGYMFFSPKIKVPVPKVADLSPIHVRKLSATDGTKLDL